MWTIGTGQRIQLATGSKLLALDLSDHCKNSAHSDLCDEYSDIFKEFKGIPPQCNIKHHVDLIDPQKSPPKPFQYKLS